MSSARNSRRRPKVNLKKVREETVQPRLPEGLKDGGHVYLTCSNCNAGLLDVWRTRPHEPEVWKLRCSCPFCGDKSFITEIQGGFHVGGYGVIKEDDETDDVPSTKIDHTDIHGDTFIFNVIKATANAKPVYRR